MVKRDMSSDSGRHEEPDWSSESMPNPTPANRDRPHSTSFGQASSFHELPAELEGTNPWTEGPAERSERDTRSSSGGRFASNGSQQVPGRPHSFAAGSPVATGAATTDSPDIYWQTSLPFRDHSTAALSSPFAPDLSHSSQPEIWNTGPQFQSNNPFLKAVQQNHTGRSIDSSGSFDESRAATTTPPPFLDQPFTSFHTSHWSYDAPENSQSSQNQPLGRGVGPPTSRGAPAEDSFNAAAPQLDAAHQADDQLGSDSIWSTQPGHPPSHPPEDLIDLQDQHAVAAPRADDTSQRSVSPFTGPAEPTKSAPASDIQARPEAATPPQSLSVQPPSRRPSPLSESEIRRREEILAETYDVRTINWTDGTTPLRQSPVLVQNKNGPCPLLALVNGLVLRTNPGVESPLVKVLRTKERISLGLLIHALFDELTTYVDEESQLPDIEALSSFLTVLHTGMNVNPRLTATTSPEAKPGTFMATRDINLYSAFNLPLVHGWLAPPSSTVHEALERVGEYHEDIQLLAFRKEELDDRASHGATLTSRDLQLLQDIESVQHFFEIQNATQLSHYGLDLLNHALEPGSISILFRNDHFSTLFKHPSSGQLFTLVTDMGYAGHAEIVWESLVDVNGSESELYSGDFRPVSHAPPPSSTAPGRRNQQEATSPRSPANDNRETSEQTDADFAYALALQFQDEEEQRARRAQAQANRQSAPPAPPRSTRTRSSNSQSINPISSRMGRSSQGSSQASSREQRGSRQSQTVRSLIPHSEPAPGDDPNAPPPTYEQAAKAPVYMPPADDPQYPGPPTSRMSSRTTTTSSRGVAGPRSSSYGFPPSQARQSEASLPSLPSMDRRYQQPSYSSATLPERPQRDKKDCIVM